MLPDWLVIENRLFEESKADILRFAAEHPEVACSFFAFSAHPVYGNFDLCLDTPENALEVAQRNEQQAIKRRKATLQDKEAWRYATSRLTSDRVVDYSQDVGSFAYYGFVELFFKELDDHI